MLLLLLLLLLIIIIIIIIYERKSNGRKWEYVYKYYVSRHGICVIKYYWVRILRTKEREAEINGDK
jgi:hypothetical protein